jgi:cell division protease FtsH
MSPEMGPQTYGAHEELMFLGREVSRSLDFSDDTARRIDAEVSRLLRESHQRAKDFLVTHRDSLDIVASALIERETLDGRDVDELVKHGRLLSDAERAALDPQGEAAVPAEAGAPAEVVKGAVLAGMPIERRGDA